MDESGQVAEQHPLRHERPLGRAGGAAGVDEQRRLRGERIDDGEAIGGRLQQGFPWLHPGLARAGDADHVREQRQAIADSRELGQRGRIDQRGHRFAVLQPVFERVRPEQDRQRHRHRPHLVAGDVGDDGLGSLRQDDADAIAAQDVRRQIANDRVVCVAETDVA